MKNKKNRLLLALASTFLVGGALTSLTACGNNAPTSSVSSAMWDVSINADNIVLDTYDSFQLVVKTNYEGTVTFTSSNPSIADVNETGLVSSYGTDGECNIVVNVGGEKRTLKTSVSDKGNMPVLEVGESEVSILHDESFLIEPKLLYKGEDVTREAEISATSSDPTTAGVNVSVNKNITISALNIGEAAINVKASIYGKQVAKEINVKIVAKGAVFLVEEGFNIDMDTLDAEDQNSTVQMHAGVYKNGTKIEGATISYESLDPSVASVTSEGLITAQKTGNCGIKLSSVNAGVLTTATVNVHVGLSVRELSGTFDMELDRSYNNIYVPATLSGDVESILWDGQNVAASYDRGSKYISLTGSKALLKASEAKSESPLSIYTSTCRYDTTVNPYSLLLRNADDLETIRYRREPGWADITKSVNIAGYYVLANDIDCSAHTFSQPGNNSYNDKYGFIGMLDGMGHSIKNISFKGSQNCLLGSVGVGGVVKNITFDNAVVFDNSYCSIIAVHVLGGTIKDVTINMGATMNYQSTDIGIVASRTVAKSTLTNITINAAGLRIANVFGNNGFNVASSNNVVINAKEVASLYYEEKDTAPHTSASGVKINYVD
ncbi:MAG: hypothetical protein MJ239_01915 [Bacilli bacterium]|nr:hypothetical protein [Bacilli bacterium]